MQNLKLAFRVMFRTPFVTVVAVTSLAFGIGANAAIFSLFNQFLLRSLPVAAPHELVNLGAPGIKQGSSSSSDIGSSDEIFSYPMFRDLEANQTGFTGLAAHRDFGTNLAFRGQVINEDGFYVSGSYFPVLGVQPGLGRLLGPADDRAIGESSVVVLDHAFWTTRLERDQSVLNETLVVNGHPMTIVGVTPEQFRGTSLGSRPAVYVPITMRGRLEPFDAFDNRRSHWIYLFGRLKPDVTIEQATASLGGYYGSVLREVEAPLQSGMSDAQLEQFTNKPLVLVDGSMGQSRMHQRASTPLMFLLVLTGAVLLIACANVANLLLARSSSRAAEMAVRLSIGASRWQLVKQLLVEACVLAALGGVVGLLMARLTLAFIASLLPAGASEQIPFVLDGTAIGFLAALTITTGIMFGLFPALHASRPNLLGVLKGQAGQTAGARSASIFRFALATVQIVLAMLLLGGAGLFLKSLVNISRVDIGLDGLDDVITFRLSPQMNGYTAERTKAFVTTLEETLAAQPGVTSVSASLVPLVSGSSWGTNVTVQGYPVGPEVDADSSYNEVGPGYLRTLGMPLMSGREFTASDVDAAPKVAIINEAFARKFDLGREAVGKRMMMGAGDGELDIEIVGLAQDAKYSDVKGDIPPVVMLPYRQRNRNSSMSIYVRTALPPDQTLAMIRPLVAELDPNLPVTDLATMPEAVRESVFMDRMISVLAGSFATLATLLAAIGLYGVLAYTVSQRTREFGLRMALGSAPSGVRRLVMRQVVWMTIIGGTIGIGLAILAGTAMQSILYELEGYDPVALGLSATVLALVALTAGFIPAYRASRVDPMRALRYE